MIKKCFRWVVTLFSMTFFQNIRQTLSFWMFLESTFPKNFSHLCLFKCFFFLLWNSNLFAQIGNIFLPVYQDWFTLGQFFFLQRKLSWLRCLRNEILTKKHFQKKKPLEDQTAKVLPKENESKHFNFNFLLKSKFHECQPPFDGEILYKSSSDVITSIWPIFWEKFLNNYKRN